MKFFFKAKLLLNILLLLLISNTATSQESVIEGFADYYGYIHLELEWDKLYLLSFPYDETEANTNNNNLQNILGLNNLPPGSNVYTWNQSEQKWNASLLTASWILEGETITEARWSPNFEIKNGDAFFVTIPKKPPNSNADDIHHLYLKGQLYDSNLDSENTVQVVKGLNMMGLKFFKDSKLSELVDIEDIKNGDNVFIWTDNGWQASLFSEANPVFNVQSGWNPDFELKVGQGFFLQRVGPDDTLRYLRP